MIGRLIATATMLSMLASASGAWASGTMQKAPSGQMQRAPGATGTYGTTAPAPVIKVEGQTLTTAPASNLSSPATR